MDKEDATMEMLVYALVVAVIAVCAILFTLVYTEIL